MQTTDRAPLGAQYEEAVEAAHDALVRAYSIAQDLSLGSTDELGDALAAVAREIHRTPALDASSDEFVIGAAGVDEPVIGLPEGKQETPEARVYTIGFGGFLNPETVADYFAELGFSGNVVTGLGFTPEWGKEVSVTLTIATSRVQDLWAAVVGALRRFNEEAAFLSEAGPVGTRAYLVWNDHRVEAIEG